MKEPIFVYATKDLDVFETIEAVESYIEPIDVKNNEYVFYDSEGKLLEATVVRDSRGIERTKIREGINHEYDEIRLSRILIAFLNNLGHKEYELEQMGLAELVRMSLKYPTR